MSENLDTRWYGRCNQEGTLHAETIHCIDWVADLNEPLPAEPNSPSPAGATAELCQYCEELLVNHKRCPNCGYSQCDAMMHGDHYLCKGKIPERKKADSPAGEARFPVGKCKKCGKEITDVKANGNNIVYCSYECYCDG